MPSQCSRVAIPLSLLVSGVVAAGAGCGGDERPGVDPPIEVDPDPPACMWAAAPDGTCLEVGVPAEACAQGFDPDGAGGCRAVLPFEKCPSGQMAVPGEPTCRPVAPCGDEPYGGIPVGADTEHVDASYAGADSDGSAARPWTTIADAIDAAAPTAVVAIAAGTYSEHLWSGGKSVRIWGRCPDLVVIEGPTLSAPTVQLTEGGAPELHGVSVRGGTIGVFASGVDKAVVEHVRVSDGAYGIGASPQFGPAPLEVRDSLVEGLTLGGLLVEGGTATIERTVVRDVAGGTAIEPRGMHAQLGATVTLARCLFESNQAFALNVLASSATVSGSVLRDMLPLLPDGQGSIAIGAYPGPSEEPSNVVVTGSEIYGATDFGGFAQGSSLSIEHTTFRAPAPAAVTGAGVGAALGSTLAVRRSTFNGTHSAGVVVQQSSATLEGVLSSSVTGFAALVRHGADADIRGSLFDESAAAAVYTYGASSTIDTTVIRDTLPDPDSGSFGDGIAVGPGDDGSPGSVSIHNVRVEASARAGVTNFGSFATLSAVVLECNPIAIDGETAAGRPYSFEEAGDVVCGCDGTEDACLVQSSMLTPPVVDI